MVMTVDISVSTHKSHALVDRTVMVDDGVSILLGQPESVFNAVLLPTSDLPVFLGAVASNDLVPHLPYVFVQLGL